MDRSSPQLAGWTSVVPDPKGDVAETDVGLLEMARREALAAPYPKVPTQRVHGLGDGCCLVDASGQRDGWSKHRQITCDQRRLVSEAQNGPNQSIDHGPERWRHVLRPGTPARASTFHDHTEAAVPVRHEDQIQPLHAVWLQTTQQTVDAEPTYLLATKNTSGSLGVQRRLVHQDSIGLHANYHRTTKIKMPNTAR